MSRVFMWAGMALAGMAVAGLWVSILSRPAEVAATAPSPTATVEQQVAPTIEAIPTPEPIPTPDTSEAMAYVDFLDHQITFSDTLMFGLDEVVAYADIYTADLLADAASDLQRDLNDELRWLDRHPPLACYRTEYRFWRDAMIQYERSMDLISDGARYLDPDAINRGSRAMTRGTTLIEKATAAMDSGGCAAFGGVSS